MTRNKTKAYLMHSSEQSSSRLAAFDALNVVLIILTTLKMSSVNPPMDTMRRNSPFECS